MNKYFESLATSERQNLIDMGIIIEDTPPDTNWDAGPENNTDELDTVGKIESFPDADYEMQNEIIKFFINNPGGEPELFRQYAVSIGIDPDEFQKQENILMSQLLNIYVSDSEGLGYGTVFHDDEVSDEIRQMVTP